MNKAEKETLLRRTAPSRQKQAQEYLQGRSPGTPLVPFVVKRKEPRVWAG